MQCCRFENGGFVLHKVKLWRGGIGHYSAWFDAAGKLLDAERINPQTGQVTPVTGRHVRAELERAGREWVMN